MTTTIRLSIAEGAEPQSVNLMLAFAAPDDRNLPLCAPALLETGAGDTVNLGVVCGPTPATWRADRQMLLATRPHAGAGPFDARLHWGETTVEATLDRARAAAAAPVALPELPLFGVKQISTDRPLERVAKVRISGLMPGQQIRLDGGAGQVHLLPGATGPEQAAEWALAYPKPGAYVVALDLLDADGFWLATLAETPLEIAPPIEVPPEGQAQPQIATAAATLMAAAAGSRPWLPYRYARPAWGWSRTYTTPGGSQVSRVVGAGACLSIRAETLVGDALWYQTGSGDWIAASAVNLMTPSELRGVTLGEPAPPPPPPPPPPPGSRTGVVTASALNVRARPGVSADNPPIAQIHAGDEITIYEEQIVAGATWYRIGDARWVHSGYVRLTGAPTPAPTPPPAPPPPADVRHGVVTATVLNVRGQPGVRADNPPVAQLRAGDAVTIYEETTYGGATWYRIGDARWAHGDWIRLVEEAARAVRNVAAATAAAAQAADRISLPVGWVVTSALNVRARPGVSDDNPPIDQVKHNQALSILETQVVWGSKWHRIGQDRWVEGGWVGVARARPRPSNIGPEARWVGVCLQEQTAVAYEGDRPVYTMLVASGLSGTPTVQGIFRTWLRLPTGKMAGGNPAYGSYYYLEDVTWTCYFYSGYSLHTAYWHDAFGRPRSHGCVNLSPYDAWWIYEWSAAGGPNSPMVYVYWA
ncbi:MAG: hypothetical protein CVU38_12765 [Chloroflexi bacterium HGW-Chloroflexi-1]|nr:MAG: hypothetical protein CVU38_12765 [Chloroflexi bacterium HGW-Chloroflexi-1]